MLVSQPIAVPLDPAARADLAAMAEDTIAKGSKSFAAAARLFDAETRRSAMMLYAWCRHCDDTIDDQVLGFARRPLGSTATGAERLALLEAETLAALRGQPTSHPSFRAVADVAARHGLPQDLLLQHIEGYRMDVEEQHYATITDTLSYCYHVAGVVGVMMSLVMGVEDETTLEILTNRLIHHAAETFAPLLLAGMVLAGMVLAGNSTASSESTRPTNGEIEA